MKIVDFLVLALLAAAVAAAITRWFRLRRQSGGRCAGCTGGDCPGCGKRPEKK